MNWERRERQQLLWLTEGTITTLSLFHLKSHSELEYAEDTSLS